MNEQIESPDLLDIDLELVDMEEIGSEIPGGTWGSIATVGSASTFGSCAATSSTGSTASTAS